LASSERQTWPRMHRVLPNRLNSVGSGALPSAAPIAAATASIVQTSLPSSAPCGAVRLGLTARFDDAGAAAANLACVHTRAHGKSPVNLSSSKVLLAVNRHSPGPTRRATVRCEAVGLIGCPAATLASVHDATVTWRTLQRTCHAAELSMLHGRRWWQHAIARGAPRLPRPRAGSVRHWADRYPPFRGVRRGRPCCRSGCLRGSTVRLRVPALHPRNSRAAASPIQLADPAAASVARHRVPRRVSSRRRRL
jgi:hypothetical protein